MSNLPSNLKTYWFGLYNEEEGPVERGDPHYGYEAREEFVSIRDYERLRAALTQIAGCASESMRLAIIAKMALSDDSFAPETKAPQKLYAVYESDLREMQSEDPWPTESDTWTVVRLAGSSQETGPNLGANIRHEGAIAVCGWCGFALITNEPRQCCPQGRAYDAASTYAGVAQKLPEGVLGTHGDARESGVVEHSPNKREAAGSSPASSSSPQKAPAESSGHRIDCGVLNNPLSSPCTCGYNAQNGRTESV